MKHRAAIRSLAARFEVHIHLVEPLHRIIGVVALQSCRIWRFVGAGFALAPRLAALACG